MLPPELTERFTQDLARIWPEGGRLGLAVSGGPDSMAMLALAHAAMPGRIAAATVDHGLRAESADEARQVAAACARLEVPHAILKVRLAPGNLQAEARHARYAALAGWLRAQALDALASAHHADDQAETVLMRLNRGSGLAGLAGVRARALVADTDLPLLRPLLTWRRTELAAVCASAGLTAIDDPSNGNDRFDRARLRKHLAGADWLETRAIAASAQHLADAELALEWAASREWQERVEHQGDTIRYHPHAPRAIAMRVVGRIIAALGGNLPRGSAVALMHDSLATGKSATLAGVIAAADADGWCFQKETGRR